MLKTIPHPSIYLDGPHRPRENSWWLSLQPGFKFFLATLLLTALGGMTAAYLL